MLEFMPFLPSLVGQAKPQVVIGKCSGIDTIKYLLEMERLEVSEEHEQALVKIVKEESIMKKRLLTREEFVDLVKAL